MHCEPGGDGAAALQVDTRLAISWLGLQLTIDPSGALCLPRARHVSLRT